MKHHRVGWILGATAAAAIATPAVAATVVVTDCSAGGGQVEVVNQSTRPVGAAGNDVILRCNLEQLPGTQGVLIDAHSLLVDGPSGGAISTTGTNGIRIRAGMNSTGTACATPGDFGASVRIEGAVLQDGNDNGNLDVKACGDVTVDSTGGSQLNSAGAAVSLTCFETGVNPATGQPCRITVDHAAFFGNRIFFDAQGDVTIVCSTFQTIGPRDLQRFTSAQGSVLAGALAIPNPDPRCVCPADCTSRFRGGIESNMQITADDNVDLEGACMDIAENIAIVANGTTPPLLAGGVMINLARAEIRNDFGKTGNIAITAHPISAIAVSDGGVQTGDGVIDVDEALIVDTGKQGGGTNPNAVATMNGGNQFLANQPCGAIEPDSSCVGRGIDLGMNPSRAAAASRTLRNVVNAAAVRCDT